MDIMSAMQQRRSARAYLAKEVSRRTIEEILCCAALGPSAINLQPWEFIVTYGDEKEKYIGVLSSGGDAPGMNAAIRAVVRTGIYHGNTMFGIKRGYQGMIEGDIEQVNRYFVSNIIKDGGTVLQTARKQGQAVLRALHDVLGAPITHLPYASPSPGR